MTIITPVISDCASNADLWTPQSTYRSSIVASYDATNVASITKNSSDVVTRLNCVADSNNNNLTGASGATTYYRSQSKFNSKPCLGFTSSNLTLADNATMGISAFSIFLVYANDSTSALASTRTVISKWSASPNFEFLLDRQTSKKLRISISTTGSNQLTLTSTTTPTDDVAHLVELHYNGTSTEMIIDGISQGTVAGTILTTGTSTLALGGTTANEPIFLGAVLWSNALLTGANLNNTRTYFRRKFGIA